MSESRLPSRKPIQAADTRNDHVRHEAEGSAFQAAFLTSDDFDKQAFHRDWLVRSILLSDQPAVIGGPKKCLKTSVTLDLALSLGSGKPFLGKFHVPRVVPVAVLSGESGGATLQETARRICASKGIKLAACRVFWHCDLPRLARADDMAALQQFLTSQAIEVVILDPLYLCLLDGSSKISASNLFDVGPLLRRAAKACSTAGATPLFVHHMVKGASKAGAEEPVGLEHLAFAGIAEFARQWILLSRREAYLPGSGQHHLVMAAGGSAGHSGSWEIDIEEGVVGDNLAARTWAPVVHVPGLVNGEGRGERTQRLPARAQPGLRAR